MKTPLGPTCVLAAALVLGAGAPAAAQQPQNERLVTADGVRLDFPPNGVWRARAQRVAARRALLRSRGSWSTLNAPAMARAAGAVGGSAAAVAGDLFTPAILIGYSDTDTSTNAVNPLPRRAQYDSIFFTTQPLAGRPYTQRTFYEEMSNGLLHIRGQAYGWRLGLLPKSYYLDACGSQNALDCSAGRLHMYQLFTDALRALDTAGVDFGQYDNDGPDGIPNSGDDDGYVDLVQFVQPVVGGECGGRGVWAHHYTLAGLGGAYATNDPAANGGTVKVGPYHIVGGVGGESCTNTGQIMGIGTASHELGHGLGLPDLYDVSGQTQGIGEWGLMGSANYRSPVSPGHMDAWCKEQLGWIVERELVASGSYALEPVVSGDTVLLIRPRAPNPRGEYFLLENKQALGSDVANMTCSSCNAGPKNGGLLVWHIDSLKIALTGFTQYNSVNAGFPHGVALVQADGLGQLDKGPSVGGNRGDGGDPYPGTFNTTAFSRGSAPAPIMNNDGSFAGFALAHVNQDVPNGRMSFDLAFATIIRASDTLAAITVSDVPYHRFTDVLSQDSAVTVGVASPQVTPDGRAQFTFTSWSDGGAQTHTITPTSVTDSLVAALDARYQLKVMQAGSGAIAPSPAADLANGEFFTAGSTVRLIATSGQDSVFDGWSGDTTSASDTLVLTMRRPYTLSGRFVPVLRAAQQAAPTAIMGATYNYVVPVQGGTGNYLWTVLGGKLPPGLYVFTDGRIGGTPEATGTFDASLRVASGSQVLEVSLRLSVEAPAVALDAAVHQLLKLDAALTAGQVRYFDLLGNRNNRLDLGDFLAWVKATGVKPSAAVMARVLAAPREGEP